jgi:hypothetical protein
VVEGHVCEKLVNAGNGSALPKTLKTSIKTHVLENGQLFVKGVLLRNDADALLDAAWFDRRIVTKDFKVSSTTHDYAVPAPLGPSKPTHSPLLTSRSNFWIAKTSPKRFVTPRARTASASLVRTDGTEDLLDIRSQSPFCSAFQTRRLRPGRSPHTTRAIPRPWES